MDPKANLLAAALRVFARHGFRKTSMSMVADEAALSRQAVYHHFTSKESLFAALVDQLQADALDKARQASAEMAACALPDKIFMALNAYHNSLVAHMSGSSFMDELLEESARHCGDVVAAHARRLEIHLQSLVNSTVGEGYVRMKQGLSEKEFIRMVLVAAKGVKLAYAQAGAKAYTSSLRQMINVICAGSVERGQIAQFSKQSRVTAGRKR